MTTPCYLVTSYLVTSYRYGWTNNVHVIGCWSDRDAALGRAAIEKDGDGGKYGIAVEEYRGDERTMVRYFPSGWGETEPKWCREMEFHERFGSDVEDLLEANHALSRVDFADLRGPINRQLDVIEEAIRNAKPDADEPKEP